MIQPTILLFFCYSRRVYNWQSILKKPKHVWNIHLQHHWTFTPLSLSLLFSFSICSKNTKIWSHVQTNTNEDISVETNFFCSISTYFMRLKFYDLHPLLCRILTWNNMTLEMVLWSRSWFIICHSFSSVRKFSQSEERNEWVKKAKQIQQRENIQNSKYGIKKCPMWKK